MSVPTTEPVSVRAGDTIAWRREDLTADYPASAGWALAYRLVNSAGYLSISASADGDAFAVLVSAATSAGYTPGLYTWHATVTKAAERYTVGTGSITVERNLAASTAYDTRSPARQALDDVDAALRLYGAKAYMQEIEIAGRRQKFATPGDFMAFRSRLQAEVRGEDNAERIAAGLAPKNKLLVRFRGL